MPKKKVSLSVVQTAHPDASILEPADPSKTALTADDDVDLLCGACGKLIGDGISLDTVKKRIVVDKELLLRCPQCKVLLRLI